MIEVIRLSSTSLLINNPNVGFMIKLSISLTENEIHHIVIGEDTIELDTAVSNDKLNKIIEENFNNKVVKFKINNYE